MPLEVVRQGSAQVVQVQPLRKVYADRAATADELRHALGRAITGLDLLIEEIGRRHWQRPAVPETVPNQPPFGLSCNQYAALRPVFAQGVSGLLNGQAISVMRGYGKTFISTALARLVKAGVIQTTPHGRGGTWVKVLDPEALRAAFGGAGQAAPGSAGERKGQ